MKSLNNISLTALIFAAFLGINGCASQSMWEAASRGDMEKVRSICKANPKLVSEKVFDTYPDYQGLIALHYAVINRQKEFAEVLVDEGANLNAQTDKGDTPLHKAVYNYEMAVMLVGKGANVNIKNNEGETVLHIAARDGRRDVAELVVTKGADVNARDSKGFTPLYYATARNYPAIADLLRQHGGVK
jgi:ankyrin repeat protein